MDLDDLDDGPLPLPPLTARAHDAPSAPPLPWAARLRNGLANYLPVLLMGLLAAASWWLVKRSPEPEAIAPSGPVRHEPDYEMRGFSVQRYTAAGPAQGVIEGDVVRHYPDSQTLEIDGVRLRWTDAAGHTLRASAARALAEQDSGLVTLQGGARVERDGERPDDPPFEFTGERMVFDTRAGRVRSQDPVTLRQGPHTFTAGSIAYDHGTRVAELGNGVQGRLQPSGTDNGHAR
jgi:lipopolysaccharide export system protein LptC